jgi:hypothetical protein
LNGETSGRAKASYKDLTRSQLASCTGSVNAIPIECGMRTASAQRITGFGEMNFRTRLRRAARRMLCDRMARVT